MLLLSLLLIAIMAGLARGGDITALGRHSWRLPLLPLVAVVVQVVAFLPDENASGAARAFAASLHVISYLLTLAFVWANRRTPWLWLVGCGLLANFLAILANGGFMPVSADVPLGALQDAAASNVRNNAVFITHRARLWFLSDVWHTPAWLPVKRAFSIGDLMVAIGAFGLVQRVMRSHGLREFGGTV